MSAFLGILNANLIYAAMFNMIISQQVFSDNISAKEGLVGEARVDGGLYGDTKLVYSTDALKSHAWGGDNEATNLLALDRPKAPSCQTIVMNVFRQIRVSLDNYLTKQGWSTEGAFAEFTSVITGWLGDTKKVYDITLYNSFIGTNKSTAVRNTEQVDITTAVGTAIGEEAARIEAQEIARVIANLMDDMSDISRDFNDYGYLRAIAKENIRIVWSSKWVNKITKLDLPTVFHKDFMDKFAKDVINSRFFGNINASSGTTAASNTTVRSLIEADYQVANLAADSRAELYPDGNYYVHVFPGDLLPNSTAYAAGETYTENSTIICKVMVKLPPYMSAFSVSTSFFNPRSLTETKFLTFGHNTIEHLYNYPFITVEAI